MKTIKYKNAELRMYAYAAEAQTPGLRHGGTAYIQPLEGKFRKRERHNRQTRAPTIQGDIS